VAEFVVLTTAVLVSIILVVWVLWRCRTGFDFSDEGFYLNWISNPWLYKASVTQYGFIYHPLYLLGGGDVALLRQINVLITLGLAWILCIALFRAILSKGGQTKSWLRAPFVGVGLVLSTSTLAYLDPWLPTPCYSSLALQALLLAGMGILLAEANASRKSLVGWGLIGFSGWLAFMAKPTTALALAIVAALYLLFTGKLRIRLLAVALVTTVFLCLISAWVIDGSVGGFVERLILGVQDAARLQGGHTLAEALRWDDFGLGHDEKIALESATCIIFLGSLLGSFKRPAGRLSAVVVVLVFSGICIWFVAGLAFPRWASTPFRGLLFWAVPYGAWLAALAGARENPLRLFSRGCLALVLFLVVLPHVYTFGTNSNYWAGGSRAAVFWVLAGVPLLASAAGDGKSWRTILPMAAGAQVITASLLFLSMEDPYRQPQPLWQQKEVVEIGVTGSRLRVAHEVADYIQNLGRLARNSGFRTGDPMLDLTGHFPGALYAIGARAIGRPWMIGGYPGSGDLAVDGLDRVSRQELRNSWILTEPTGPRRLSSRILERYGIDLAKNYVEVGVVNSPKGKYPGGYEQHLFKPGSFVR
jgi:hypothetical protein